MKIAINCAELDYPRIDGTRVYVKNLLDWFGRLDRETEFLLYHKGDFNPMLEPKIYPNYTERKIPFRFFWTQTRLARELWADRPDVVWMPIQQLPRFGPSGAKYAVTIHDLAFKLFPETFPGRDVLKHNFFANHAIRKADQIIAISETTRKDILKFFPKISARKIKVVHHGFDGEVFGDIRSSEEIDRVLRKYRILSGERGDSQNEESRYLIYIGAIQPRKNLITLIRAFEILKARHAYPGKLVLAGSPAWKAERTLEKIEKSPNKRDIILTGRVDFGELAALCQGAEASVYPPLYEGFGIPILEAMASGTPTVVADNSSLVEVAAEAARRFESENPEALARVLKKIFDDPELRKELIKKGKERAREFSWERCARETLGILKLVGSE